MAILSVNGLDHMTQASDFFIGRALSNDFSGFNGTVNYLPTGGVSGGGALEVTNGAWINGGFTGSDQGAGGWFKLPSGFSTTFIAQKWSGNSSFYDFGIRINANGSIDALGDESAPAIPLAPAGFIEAETYYYFCFWHVRSASGTVTLRINNTVLTTPVDDFVDTTVGIRYFEGGSIIVDDLFITNTDETDLPPQLIYNLTPDANNSPQDFSVAGAATAWEAIDEVRGDGDTSYIYSGTVGHVSKFDLSDLPVEVTSITALQPYVTASRDGEGANVNASFTVKTAAAANVSTQTIALSTGLYNIYAPPGAVNTAYTPADVDGMTLEFEVLA